MRLLRTTRGDRLLVGGAFLVALAVRLMSVPAATTDGLRLVSPDCYAHLRRARAVARRFPHVPVRDAWLNHPDGGIFIWPPAFDLLVGGTARLAYGSDATQAEVARVLATLPPLLGALHVVPLFLLVRRVLSRRRAALAVAGYALLPAAAIWSQFGHGDHHVAETLLLLLLLLALARAREEGLPPGVSLRRALLAGAAAAAMVLTWQGAVFAAALAFLWAAFALRAREAVLLALSATGFTALGTAPYVAGLDLPFTFISFGWFQPVLLLAGRRRRSSSRCARAERPAAPSRGLRSSSRQRRPRSHARWRRLSFAAPSTSPFPPGPPVPTRWTAAATSPTRRTSSASSPRRAPS
jgi:asparagine N-glycosylation enzyme membrane subunit Stt3